MPERRQQQTTIIGLLACCVAVGLLVAAPALAKDLKNGKKRYYGGSDGAYEGSGAVGLPTRIPGIGTYAGALAGERFRGNGNYFYYQGAGAYGPIPVPADSTGKQPQGLKIIEVGKDAPNEECDEASGVCIIRP